MCREVAALHTGMSFHHHSTVAVHYAQALSSPKESNPGMNGLVLSGKKNNNCIPLLHSRVNFHSSVHAKPVLRSPHILILEALCCGSQYWFSVLECTLQPQADPLRGEVVDKYVSEKYLNTVLE